MNWICPLRSLKNSKGGETDGIPQIRVTSSHRRDVQKYGNITPAGGEITTTETRASEIKQLTEKMITLGKGDLHAQTGSIVLNR